MFGVLFHDRSGSFKMIGGIILIEHIVSELLLHNLTGIQFGDDGYAMDSNILKINLSVKNQSITTDGENTIEWI